ncbi:MAG: hypothetical protein ACJ73D_04045 [Pyrinomonadaceae bacterium]
MATDRERNVKDTFDAVLAFNGEHSAEYAAIAEAATQANRIQAAAAAMETYMATQTSGDAAFAVELKSILKASARRRMLAFSRTAKALGKTNPGFEELFDMPKSDTYADVLAKGRELVGKATTHHVLFATVGIPASKATDLSDILDQLEGQINAKTVATGATVAATAGIDAQMEDGMQALDLFDAIMRNFYEDDPATLAAWKSASHIKRAPKKSTTPPTPPPPGP